jgi:exodeoxyribonuclease V alpha subunit
MHQSFDPQGTISSREEFREYARSARAERGGARLLLDELGPLARSLDLDDAVFFLAWELVALQPGLTDAEQRAALMLVLATLINSRQGSTCLPLGGPLLDVLRTMLPEDLRGEAGFEPDLLAAQIEQMLSQGRLEALVAERGDDLAYKPLILDAGKLYQQRMLHYEGLLIDALNERFARQIASVQTDGIAQHLDAIWAGLSGFSLTSEQRYAVLTAVHLPLTIITGGPGTGKTSIVVSLLRLLARQGVDPTTVALAAPTGKAAHRMLESITYQLRAATALEQADQNLLERLPKPQTLHRLLGYSRYSGQFHHHEHNPLDARVVIVDEASMIDMFLMEHLVRATRDETHVILLGDVDQLPSVDAGAVLRDLAAPEGNNHMPWRLLLGDDAPEHALGDAPTARFTVRLTRSHRMSADDVRGRNILLFAQRVREGRADDVIGEEEDQLTPLAAGFDFEDGGARWLDCGSSEDEAMARERIRQFTEQWYEQVISTDNAIERVSSRVVSGFDEEKLVSDDEISHVRACFEHMQRARLLALTRSFFTGTQSLNEDLLERLRRDLGARSDLEFIPGTPVMMTRNDYDKEIFNGDQGIVLPAISLGKEELMAFFPQGDGFVAYGVEGLRSSLEVSFAMTVHKSQGSEFEHIALILPPDPIPLLTREVVYTAVTRSKTGALVAGSREVLEEAIRRKMIRHSSLDVIVA